MWAATLEVVRAHAERAARALSQTATTIRSSITGCGSPYYLALAAAAIAQELTGSPARGLPASEIWLNPRAALPMVGRGLLVHAQPLGRDHRTLRAVESFRAAGHGDVLTLSCYPGRPLTALGDVNLIFPAGRRQPGPDARLHSAAHWRTVAVIAIWAGRDDLLEQLTTLPATPAACLTNRPSCRQPGRATRRSSAAFFLGSGSRYGLACELSLKMKEMSLSDSEPFHFLDFRHGPQSMAGPGALIVGLVSEATSATRPPCWTRCGAWLARGGDRRARCRCDAGFGVSELVRGTLYLLFGQMLAYERSCRTRPQPRQAA